MSEFERWIVLIAVVAIMGIGWFIAYLAAREKRIEAKITPDPSRMPVSAQLLVMLLGGLFFAAMVVWMFQPSGTDRGGTHFGSVAGLILIGLAAFVAAMNLLSLTAARIGMLDGRFPFGLPDGSVRAVLTISFIILVGVISSYLITGYQNRSPFVQNGIPVSSPLDGATAEALARELRAQHQATALVSVRAEPLPAARADEPAPVPRFTVIVLPRAENQMADDLAKQTFTMIMTILAAMIGFYFAAKTGAEGSDPAAAKVTERRAELKTTVDAHADNAELKRAREWLETAKSLPEDRLTDEIRTAMSKAEANLGLQDQRLRTASDLIVKETPTLSELDKAVKDLSATRGELTGLVKSLPIIGETIAPAIQTLRTSLQQAVSDKSASPDFTHLNDWVRAARALPADTLTDGIRASIAQAQSLFQRLSKADDVVRNGAASAADLDGALKDLDALKDELARLVAGLPKL